MPPVKKTPAAQRVSPSPFSRRRRTSPKISVKRLARTLKAHARVCLELADDSSKPFRSLVAPLCLAQALVVSTGHHIAEQGAGKIAGKPARRKGAA